VVNIRSEGLLDEYRLDLVAFHPLVDVRVHLMQPLDTYFAHKRLYQH
jgi:hypothetical protein